MGLDNIAAADTEVQETTLSEDKLSDHELIEATKAGEQDAYAKIGTRYPHPCPKFPNKNFYKIKFIYIFIRKNIL